MMRERQWERVKSSYKNTICSNYGNRIWYYGVISGIFSWNKLRKIVPKYGNLRKFGYNNSVKNWIKLFWDMAYCSATLSAYCIGSQLLIFGGHTNDRLDQWLCIWCWVQNMGTSLWKIWNFSVKILRLATIWNWNLAPFRLSSMDIHPAFSSQK